MTTYTVSSAMGISTALKSAKDGDVIRLDAQTYSNVKITGVHINGNVTITSTNPSVRAVLSDLSVKDSSGITFKALDLYTAVDNKQVYSIWTSNNIVLDGVEVHGKGGLGSATETSSLLVRESSNVTIKNSEFHDMVAGISIIDTTGTNIERNYIHNMRIDGIHGGGNSNLVIQANLITNFTPIPGDHTDGIQLWTTNTTTSAHDIAIRDNMILRGDGEPTQGIFLKADPNLPFENVDITGNLVVGQSYRGVSVTGATDVNISSNTVLGFKDRMSWISVDDGIGVDVESNTATTFKVSGVNPDVDSNELARSVDDNGAQAIDTWLRSHPSFNGGWGTAASFLSKAGLTYTAAMAAADAVKPNYVLISGTSGDDRLRTSAGLDSRLEGGAGNDLLIGASTRENTLVGGKGDDVYYVVGVGDKVVENYEEGKDRVHASVDYELPSNVEDLRLVVGGLTGIGNELDNTFYGSTGIDTIYGMDGNDTIRGDAGDDSILGGSGADKIYGDDGDDTISGDGGVDKIYGGAGDDQIDGGDGDDYLEGNLGNDSILGGGGADALRGLEGNDILDGSAGDDTIIGGVGSDRLTGGTGKDVFQYFEGDFGSKALDLITDFKSGEDKINLKYIDARTASISDDAFKFIGLDAFHHVAGELRYEVVGSSAYVYGDTNGDGVADIQIMLENVKTLQVSDFIL